MVATRFKEIWRPWEFCQYWEKNVADLKKPHKKKNKRKEDKSSVETQFNDQPNIESQHFFFEIVSFYPILLDDFVLDNADEDNHLRCKRGNV